MPAHKSFFNHLLSNVCVLLPILNFSLFASRRYDFFLWNSTYEASIQDSPPYCGRLGVLYVLFNKVASGPVSCLFLKLQTLMYSSSCTVVHGLPLSHFSFCPGHFALSIDIFSFLATSCMEYPSFLKATVDWWASGKCYPFLAILRLDYNRTRQCWCSRYAGSPKKASLIVSFYWLVLI